MNQRVQRNSRDEYSEFCDSGAMGRILGLCAHERRFRAFSKTFSSLLSFDALFTRTKGKYYQCIELAPTSAGNC